MCDADDSDSQCAKGCVPHEIDEDAAVITEDEKPDENEEFEQYSEISFNMELTLDYGSTDGTSLSDVASQISEDLKSVYEDVNPFDQAVTTVDVSIEQVERCMSTKDLGLQPEDVFGSEDCEPETEKRRKRKSAEARHIKALMSAVSVNVRFTGEYDDSVPLSSAGKDILASKIRSGLSKLGSDIEHFSGDQLCDYAATSLGRSRKWLTRALNRFESEELMKIWPIQTKKPEGNKKFYLHSWMGSLKDNVKDLPLSMLAIPGSHNSASYDLQWKYTWKPTWDPRGRFDDVFYYETKHLENRLFWPYPRAKYFKEIKKFYGQNRHLPESYRVDYNPSDPANEFKFFEAWNTCLRSNTLEQLLLGIRYFDYK